MRGSPLATQIAVMPSGIIPAHAGLTPRGPSSAVAPRDHPRACGAHTEVSDMKKQYEGSSPRMRGSLRLVSSYRSPSGIIPAHAGLTTVASFFSGPAKDHPRACGAHFCVPPYKSIRKGSSPRMRGSLDVWPATPIRMGSSPRMRGSHLCLHPSGPSPGIIPAHAGLTAGLRLRERRIWDHPRACGAHFPFDEIALSAVGSSPRMRGSPIGSNYTNRKKGIIPAHAGLTGPSAPSAL